MMSGASEGDKVGKDTNINEDGGTGRVTHVALGGSISGVRWSAEGIPDDVLLQCLIRVPRVHHGTLKIVCKKWREVVESDLFTIQREKEGKAEDWLYVVGGVRNLAGGASCNEEPIGEVLIPWMNLWEPFSCEGLHMGDNHLFDLSCAAIGSRLFIIGGFESRSAGSPSGSLKSNAVAMYDSCSQKWDHCAPMLCPREGFACSVIENKIYVAGGLSREAMLQSESGGRGMMRVTTAEVYDPITDQWSLIMPMREGRSCCAGAAVSGRFYVFGGFGVRSLLSSVEIFDPATGRWGSGKPMPSSSWVVAGCAVLEDRWVYVVAANYNSHELDRRRGQTAGMQMVLASYDVLEDEWIVIGGIPTDRLLVHHSNGMQWEDLTLGGCGVAAVESKVYVVGGSSPYDGAGLNTTMVYDPKANVRDSADRWYNGPWMRSRRHGLACTVIRR
ncbi:hypothetical protein CBR_g37301 [Chara braunii]|uniref:F-box domain-containing protein n=1 Tax=Chara braunii TaxID=69332 RepID=A0A388LMY0_CHABU|nr:hypothetical protein CBR_g37301 [Chara braunii]|eukprot:GBG83583.1 hypothetical protein CBR_g37301 [Chara braunii]